MSYAVHLTWQVLYTFIYENGHLKMSKWKQRTQATISSFKRTGGDWVKFLFDGYDVFYASPHGSEESHSNWLILITVQIQSQCYCDIFPLNYLVLIIILIFNVFERRTCDTVQYQGSAAIYLGRDTNIESQVAEWSQAVDQPSSYDHEVVSSSLA